MELRHLRFFISQAGEENVSHTVLKLHASHPSLNRRIHDLEDKIGFQLFGRNTKSVRLIEAGRII